MYDKIHYNKKKNDSIFISIQNSETLGYKSNKICIGSIGKKLQNSNERNKKKTEVNGNMYHVYE